MEGFIQLHKKICDWEWYTDIPTKTLFFHIMLKCNYKEAKWKGKIIKPGEFITSLEHLSLETGLSRQQVRTAIKKLESTGEITHYATNEYTTLVLNNWEVYNTQDNKRATNEQQTSNKRITTTNKEYNENKDNNENKLGTIVSSKPNEYKISISYLKNIENENIPEYAENYREEWTKFCYYWSEVGKSGKIRAETEKTFELKRRFATWMSRKKETITKQQIKFNSIG